MAIMRTWIPVPRSLKGRLVLTAVKQFGSQPFDQVTVGGLAQAAEVTTGALYHHFGSKAGLYAFVRADVETRLLDRMEGALASAPPGDGTASVTPALLVGFDLAINERFPYLLGEPAPGGVPDRLAAFLADHSGHGPASAVLGRVLAASWRAALLAVTDGADVAVARVALGALSVAPPRS